MATGVKFRGYQFLTAWSNHITPDAPQNRVKFSSFPGTPGGVAMNMKQGERRITHNGVARRLRLSSLYSVFNKINSVCDGELCSTGSNSLLFHGQSMWSCYADTVQWGPLKLGHGSAGMATFTNWDGYYYFRPFSITYVQSHP